MSSAPKAKPTQQIALPPQREGIPAAVEECLQRSATVLFQHQVAEKADLIHAVNLARQSNSHGHPADLLEILARHLGHEEPEFSRVIASYGEKIAATLIPSPPSIPFAGKFIAPNAFYESFPELRQLGHALMAPVIYAEDSDAIGTAAINPIAAAIMGEEITAAVVRRYNIRPFVTSVILEYPSWTETVRKHFQR